MKDFEIENGVLLSYNGSDTHVVIPDGVTETARDAFFECKFIESIKFPNTMTKIGDYSFHRCLGLTEVTIPASVKELGMGAFFQCFHLKSVVIEGDGVVFNDRVFQCCTRLERVEMRGKAYIDGKFIFDECDKLVDENGFIIIGDTLCEYHGRKKKMVIPENIKIIGPFAFKGTSIKSVTFPPTLYRIGEHSFYDCDDLERIELPSGIREIPESAFAGCFRLKEVILPETVERIRENAFASCFHLKSINLPNGLKELNGFSSCLSLEEIYIPESVEKIGEYTFRDCNVLRRVHLPKRFARQQPVWYKNRFPYDTIVAAVLDSYAGESKAEVTMLGFVAKRAPKHIRSLVALERLDLVKALLDLQEPSNDEITKYIDTFTEENRTELVAILLEYRGSCAQKIGELYSLDDNVEPSDKRKRR